MTFYILSWLVSCVITNGGLIDVTLPLERLEKYTRHVRGLTIRLDLIFLDFLWINSR